MLFGFMLVGCIEDHLSSLAYAGDLGNRFPSVGTSINRLLFG